MGRAPGSMVSVRLAGDRDRLGSCPRGLGGGYATEGAAACMDYAVDILGWEEIIHTILPENAGSVGVAERPGSRLLRQVATPPPFEGQMWNVYGQTGDAWRSRRIKGA